MRERVQRTSFQAVNPQKRDTRHSADVMANTATSSLPNLNATNVLALGVCREMGLPH